MESGATILSLAILLASMFVSTFAHAADSAPAQYSVQKTLPVGGEGRWDYVTFDSDSHRLWATRSTHTQAIDPADGKVVADITGQKRAHGTAIVPAAGRGFITDGQAGSIVIFDLKSGEVLGNAAAADDADGIIYDSASNLVLVTCGDAAKLAVLKPDVDPRNGKAELIDLGGKPEFLAADGQGKAYVCVNDKNEIAAVDLKTMAVSSHWPTGSGTKPTGIAIDPKHHQLFVGCRNEKLIVMSTEDGKVMAELPIGKGNDACGFDPGTGEAFASCGDGTLTVAKETSEGKFQTSTVKTQPGARTLAIDPATHAIYLPTAEFDKAAPGEKRPPVKAGSFMIVVVAPAKGA